MKKTIELSVAFLSGGIFTILLISKVPQKEFETKQKAIIDYKLEANGKVVDTIWIYKIK